MTFLPKTNNFTLKYNVQQNLYNLYAILYHLLLVWLYIQKRWKVIWEYGDKRSEKKQQINKKKLKSNSRVVIIIRIKRNNSV